MAGLSKEAIEKYVTPKITQLTECRLANLSFEFPNWSNWVAGLILMSIFNSRPSKENLPALLQFVRRLEMAFEEYARMGEEVQAFLSGNPKWSPLRYYRVLHHGEIAVAMLYQAYDFLRHQAGVDLFKKHDQSPLQRLNSIYNDSKHQIAMIEDTVWLSNDGFNSVTASLLFTEFEELARTGATFADEITNTKKSDIPK